MTVQLEIRDHVATVTLNRPEAMNAVDLATEAELQRIWSAIENDPEVRVVVLTGVGERAFCTGADLKIRACRGWNTGPPPGLAALAGLPCGRR